MKRDLFLEGKSFEHIIFPPSSLPKVLERSPRSKMRIGVCVLVGLVVCFVQDSTAQTSQESTQVSDKPDRGSVVVKEVISQ